MSILEKIVEEKRRELANKTAQLSLAELRARAEASLAPRGFVASLKASARPAIIAEVKRASPSKGIIRADLEPVETAVAYANHGAAAVSILTDRSFFSGEDAYIEQARPQVGAPLLRQQFLTDSFHVRASRALGAAAILLIVAILQQDTLHALATEARSAGLDLLIEVHSEEELTRAVEVIRSLENSAQDSQVALGINNRDLNTFVTSLETTRVLASEAKSLLASLKSSVPLVAESGIANAMDLQLLTSYGAEAFLIGESLVSSGDPGKNLAKLIEEFQETAGDAVSASGG